MDNKVAKNITIVDVTCLPIWRLDPSYSVVDFASLVHTEFQSLTVIQSIGNLVPNFPSLDSSLFELEGLRDKYFTAEKDVVFFLPFHFASFCKHK